MEERPDTLLIVDFGSQYTQLIARRIRELNVYSQIVPFNKLPAAEQHIKGVILSGGPASVTEQNAPTLDTLTLSKRFPTLGICYGAQLMAKQAGGAIERSAVREFGRAVLTDHKDHPLLEGVSQDSHLWMSHSDSILQLPEGFHTIARTRDIPIAAFADPERQRYGLQFHPEVSHTVEGSTILRNFVFNICKATPNWTPAHYIEQTIVEIREELGPSNRVICALSGGVDSTVAATLLHQAVGERLQCVFVNNGVLRQHEFEEVLAAYDALHLPVRGVDASDIFLDKLEGKSDPEEKRKIIGNTFIEVFEAEAGKLEGITHLGQGTIYPDVIESVSVNGPSVTIKSHHNVGGLPERMHLKVLEPLRYLFKDEVRRVGRELGIPQNFLGRHPFPGPGLAIRLPGVFSRERVALLQQADRIFIDALVESGLYDDTWQAFAVLLPVQSVGVMGDERTYENVVALRAVTSIDGMTADWAHLPHDFLATVSNRIINQVQGINRVVYDISSKPPATIEWE